MMMMLMMFKDSFIRSVAVLDFVFLFPFAFIAAK